MFTLFGFTSLQITTAILLVAGIILRIIISKRRFDRRSITGLQQFRSYWSALIVTILERLFGIVASLMIIAGLLLVLVGWYNQSNIK